ncbi:MAG: 3-dehydroquinate synthase [Oscillospiraceae bacterium]|nr:3-dehydroquinate synthase [Oscillospiraceae bacterium]
MRTIKVNTAKPYEIHIANGLLNRCGELTAELINPCSAMIVSDNVVYNLYGDTVKTSYESVGFKVDTFIFPNGEHSKNLGTVEKLLIFMAEQGITRSGLVIALGGGVVGDLAGFAAAIYLRGISYVQIPTTLLAAVDSSVGGKTGVDMNIGKNLIGAFHQPTCVFCDPETFKTLPSEIFNDGLCEIIKYGCIYSENLFNMLLNEYLYDKFEYIVGICVNIKREIVERDEFDRNERQLLNFGHTAGHAIEALSDYKISHGRAVAMGMKIMEKDDRLMKIFHKYNININCPYNAKELAYKALTDKKREGEKITLVFLEKIGKAYLKKVNTNELENIFAKGLS